MRTARVGTWTRRLVAPAAVVLALAVPGAAGAAPAGAVPADRHGDRNVLELTSVRQAVNLGGVVRRTGPTGRFPGVPQCAATDCQHFVLQVDLHHAFAGRPGGVQPT